MICELKETLMELNVRKCCFFSWGEKLKEILNLQTDEKRQPKKKQGTYNITRELELDGGHRNCPGI